MRGNEPAGKKGMRCRASCWWVATLVAAFTLVMANASAATGLVTEALRLPMPEAGQQGLEALLIKPAGPGRHPLAILSHGAPRLPQDRVPMTARGLSRQAIVLARRGFVAVSVLRRGYGSSPGGWAEGYGPCDRPDYIKAGRAAAADLRAAITALSRRDDVDASRIVAIGVSAGGFASLALAADPPPGLALAISFAGGRGNQGRDVVCRDERLVDAFRDLGARSRLPTLWVYAQNDHYFGPALAHRLHEVYVRAGGDAELVMVPAVGDEGHYIFSSDIESVWVPLVDAFLKKHKLP